VVPAWKAATFEVIEPEFAFDSSSTVP